MKRPKGREFLERISNLLDTLYTKIAGYKKLSVEDRRQIKEGR